MNGSLVNIIYLYLYYTYSLGYITYYYCVRFEIVNNTLYNLQVSRKINTVRVKLC